VSSIYLAQTPQQRTQVSALAAVHYYIDHELHPLGLSLSGHHLLIFLVDSFLDTTGENFGQNEVVLLGFPRENNAVGEGSKPVAPVLAAHH